MIKLSDLIIRLRAMTHDERAIEYKDDDWLRFANDALRFIRRTILDIYPAMLADMVMEGILQPHHGIIYLYDAPTRLLSLKVGDRKLIQINPCDEEEVGRKNDNPAGYYVFGFDKIKVAPKPKCPMRYEITAIQDFEPLKKTEDVLPIPADFEDFVAEYCILRASLTNEFNMQEEAQLTMAIRSEIVEWLKAFLPAGVMVRGYW